MTQSSCLYIGEVVHRRLRPRRHRLRYRVFWLLLDLDEIGALSKRLSFFSHNRFNLTSFHEADHGDGGNIPLRRQVDALLRRAGCATDDLTIKLLCMPRILGYGFNPLSTYFCLRGDGSLEAIIYQVHNTFGERHSYVIPARAAPARTLEQHCAKEFYVSPFLGMDMSYTFRVLPPAEQVRVSIRGQEQGKTVIAASLSGTRHEISDGLLIRTFATHPLLTLKVIAAIHWQALLLVLKGFRLHSRAPASAGGIEASSGRGLQP